MKDKTLHNARQDWVINEINMLKSATPIADVADKMEVGMSSVSMVYNKKQGISTKFFQKFCDVYGFNWEAVNGMLIERIQQGIVNNNPDNKHDENQSTTENNNLTFTNDELKKSLHSLSTQDILAMINRLIGLMEEKEKNMNGHLTRLIDINSKHAETVMMLSNIIAQREGRTGKNEGLGKHG